MNIIKKITSYVLPITVIIIIPSVIFSITEWRINSITVLLSIGGIVLIAGFILMIICIRHLETKGKGTLAPWASTVVLVKSGPYKYIRNPLITGVLTVLIGISLISGSFWIALWALVFFVINTVYFKLIEEKKLVKRFGDEYVNYRQNTPMWIPKIKK